MTDGWNTITAVLPEEVRRLLRCLPPDVRDCVQELRLRAGQAVSISVGGVERFVTADGRLTEAAGGALHCTAAWLRLIVDRVCEQSLYAHQEELRQGFLPAPAGCRIGIAGTAVVENGCITGYRNITSLCFRVAREHRGCASALAERLCENGVCGALICGEPSSGKTSLLRDLLREFAARRLSCTVVDERGELTGGGVYGCDILRGSPKAAGVGQAVRCLAPRVIVFDELGGQEEIRAVCDALACGVPVVASAHCRTPQDLLHRDGMRSVLQSGAFTYVVQLEGRTAPGTVARLLRTEEWMREAVGDVAATDRGHRPRFTSKL